VALENHWYVACPGRKLKNQPLALEIFGKVLVFLRPLPAMEDAAKRVAPVAVRPHCFLASETIRRGAGTWRIYLPGCRCSCSRKEPRRL